VAALPSPEGDKIGSNVKREAQTNSGNQRRSTGPDGTGRAHLSTLPHRILHVPARLVRHARALTLRPAPGHGILAEVIARLRRLPLPA
jgi:hypothetical protein